MKAVIILSGGMDSATLLYDIVEKYEVSAVCFNYGQRHIKEIKCAEKLCEGLNIPLKVINLEILGEIAPSSLTSKDIDVPEGHYEDDNMKVTVVPNRNMVMLSLATSYALGIKANKIFYGAHFGDHEIYPDCREVFVDAMKKAIELCDLDEVELNAPYINFSKGDIVKIGIKSRVPYEDTWTCYKGLDKACGKCGSCQERLEAFKDAGETDPIQYQ